MANWNVPRNGRDISSPNKLKGENVIGFIQTRYGATVFLCLSILSFLVGGGVAQVVFFAIAWGVATQIRQPLAWWRKSLSGPLRRRFAGGW